MKLVLFRSNGFDNVFGDEFICVRIGDFIDRLLPHFSSKIRFVCCHIKLVAMPMKLGLSPLFLTNIEYLIRISNYATFWPVSEL